MYNASAFSAAQALACGYQINEFFKWLELFLRDQVFSLSQTADVCCCYSAPASYTAILKWRKISVECVIAVERNITENIYNLDWALNTFMWRHLNFNFFVQCLGEKEKVMKSRCMEHPLSVILVALFMLLDCVICCSDKIAAFLSSRTFVWPSASAASNAIFFAKNNFNDHGNLWH